jgi:hypothetical protein
MAVDALEAAYPNERSDLTFQSGLFSPDGGLIAVVLMGISIGDPEQVWLYDLHSRFLVAVTERPQNGSVRIRHLVWGDDGVLYVSAERIHRVGHPYFVAATMKQATEIDAPTEQIAKTLQQSVLDLTPSPISEIRSNSYIVSVKNLGHGDIVLSARMANGGESFQISRGSWELASFRFDADGREVLYPVREAIMSFDLKTRQSRYLVRSAGSDVRLLDRNKDGLLAYTVAGPCGGTIDYKSDVRQPRRVCFSKSD